jgi:hypothetical protein
MGRSAKAGLIFPVARADKLIRQYRPSIRGKRGRVSLTAPIYIAGVVEYLTAEVLDIAGSITKDHKKKRITPEMIRKAFEGDPDLHRTIGSNTYISGSGESCLMHYKLRNIIAKNIERKKLKKRAIKRRNRGKQSSSSPQPNNTSESTVNTPNGITKNKDPKDSESSDDDSESGDEVENEKMNDDDGGDDDVSSDGDDRSFKADDDDDNDDDSDKDTDNEISNTPTNHSSSELEIQDILANIGSHGADSSQHDKEATQQGSSDNENHLNGDNTSTVSQVSIDTSSKQKDTKKK